MAMVNAGWPKTTCEAWSLVHCMLPKSRALSCSGHGFCHLMLPSYNSHCHGISMAIPQKIHESISDFCQAQAAAAKEAKSRIGKWPWKLSGMSNYQKVIV